MIAKSYIVSNLRALDRRFNQTSGKEALFCSKLAIIELCGWIEESMDDIVQRCAIRSLTESENRNYCAKQIIRNTYSFEYEKFRFMLIRLLGLVNVERIESDLDQQRLMLFKATLENLRNERNREAHTHLKGVTRTLSAPSNILGQVEAIYLGLKEIDRVLRARRW